MVDKVTESFLNWGFNPFLMKGEYFLFDVSSIDTNTHPQAIDSDGYILSGGELINVWSGEDIIRDGKKFYISFSFPKSTVLRMLGYYEEGAEEEETLDQLESLKQKIQDFDMDKWVRNFKSGDEIFSEWYLTEDDWADRVEYASFRVNKHFIEIDIRESTLEVNWATKYLIKRTKL